MAIKFNTTRFMTGFIGGSFMTFFITNPCSKSGMIGSIIIGLLIGILYEEMCRYNKILEDDPNYTDSPKSKRWKGKYNWKEVKTRKVPVTIKFKRKDGSIARIKGTKCIIDSAKP